MPDLNFDALREAVENDTFLPEFTEIRRRARRHRRWRRLVNAARILGVLIIAAPGLAIVDVVFTHIYHPVVSGGTAAGISNGDTNSAPLGAVASGDAATASVVAVDGIDSAHTYALIDVCLLRSCSLQLSQVNPKTELAPQSVGLVRSTPTQTLTNPRLSIVNVAMAYVSAVPAGSPRVQIPISVQPATGTIPATPRPIQVSVLGVVRAVTGTAGVPQNIPTQPPVSGPDLVSTVHGWWVIGTLPTEELGVSVSHDNGATWTVHSTGIKAIAPTADGSPNVAFATTNGTDMFVLARTDDGMKMLYSTDAGVTWHPIASTVIWPFSTSFSLVATPAGEIIASFTSGSVTTYLSSSDYGGTFRSMPGAPAETGNVVRVGSELITLGLHSQVSTDGVNWQEALIPTTGSGS